MDHVTQFHVCYRPNSPQQLATDASTINYYNTGSRTSRVLSKLADTVSGVGCNILDSRQAIYGQDFSLTMIIEGTQSAITQAECLLPQTCQQHNLLSMMKRTKKHCKQNLEHLADVIVRGESTSGLIDQLTHFFSQYKISVSAFRLKFLDQDSQQDQNHKHMKCKMVISIPHQLEVEQFEAAFHDMLSPLNLQGSIKRNH